jgi:putative membrane protein
MNKRVIKAAHVVAIGIFLLLGVGFATNQEPNQNQNQNSNQNSQNKNANRQSSKENINATSDMKANTNSQPNANQNSNQNRANMNADQPANPDQNTGQAQGTRVAGSAVSNADQKFIMTAAKAGLKEVELSRIAAERATDPNLKQFAEKMVAEHSKANEELMQIATGKGISLPTTPDEKLQQTITRLQGLSGAEFDRAYLKEAGVSEHEKAVKLFEQHSQKGSDADTKAFAAKVLPNIQEHLRMVREIEATQKTN